MTSSCGRRYLLDVGYANGQIPLSVLTQIHPCGHLLHDAAVAYEAMRLAAKADGVELRPAGCDASAYRTLHWQRYFKSYWCSRGQCQKAATPGTSNHGRGDAVDFYLDPAGRVYRWLSAHAHKFGFSHAEGARVGELWHWVYIGGYHPARDSLWFLTDRERRLVYEYERLRHLHRPTKVQIKRRQSVWRWMRDQRGRIYAEARHDGGWHSHKSQANRRLSRYRALYKLTH